MALITMCLGVTAAAYYEIYEWVVNNWFGQHLHTGETDTITDLADGFLGAGIGGLFLADMGGGELHEPPAPVGHGAADPRRGAVIPSRPAAITALQLCYVAWAVLELAHGRPGNALALLVVFVVLQVPRFMRLPVIFDIAFLVAWTLQELGQVAGFWGRYPWWDTLVHAALPAVLAPTGLILLVRAGVLPDVLQPSSRREAVGTVLLVFLVAAGFGTVYELYEWFADAHLGMHYQPDNTDTMTDILANDLGGLAGGLLLVAAATMPGQRRWTGLESSHSRPAIRASTR